MSGSTTTSSSHKFKVFSTKKVTVQNGEADTQRKYWLVESDSKSLLMICPIDEQTWLPTGRPHPITLHELQKKGYTPESDSYVERIQTNMAQHKGRLSLQLIPEKEAPPVDEAVVVSDFQKGMELLHQGNREKADSVFSNLLHAEVAFEEKHKHLFNDFAIQLRKNNLPSQAIAYYDQALKLAWSNEDENLHINMARVLYAEKQYAGCVQHLFEALRISPGHRVTLNFLAWLDQQKLVPKQYALQIKSCLTQKTDPAQNPDEDAETGAHG